MTSPVRAWWDAPAAIPPPPRRVWRDWVLVGVLAPLTFVEAALRPEVPFRWLWAGVLLALVPLLLWRRTHPLTTLTVAFAAGSIISLQGGGEPELFTTAYFLILLYAVMRWGSGRAMLLGGLLVLVGWLTSFLSRTPTAADAIGGIAVVVAVCTLGVAFRWRSRARARELDRMRLLEREQLARDLHDTVAHHVSAIAIQAQAGTAVAETDPDAAARVLRVIEGEASRTLDEMRAMVRVLRREDAADLSPLPGIGELSRLAESVPGRPQVRVAVTGGDEALPPAVAAATFRIAQEAVTNARRHARHAARIDVAATHDADGVRLEVHDDGEAAASAPPGYGITGMVERATLLGGTCAAGPDPDGGWTVTAVLPRTGWTL
ncbi:sensor histidine kinase [Microbacterium sp. CFBP9034]|uniref:sensor histidine kinase n=1 Tax=Microbacterium sp. CFBP9034 TaxID=3096540 RepID=UPI002A6A0C39|nr:histidine kinase [Microbacterium sp. CFBP9034]MDY0908038.1 histidine kinase [Microbacterium sp. CFBP9034]